MAEEMEIITITRLAILAALAAILQISAGLFPGIGYLLSIFGTLPILIASIFSLTAGGSTFIVASLIILIIQPAEAPIFLLTTGLLGLAMGYGINQPWSILQSIIYSGLVLGIGIWILIFVLGIPAFGGLTNQLTGIWRVLSVFVFAIVYSGLWRLSIYRIEGYLNNFN